MALLRERVQLVRRWNKLMRKNVDFAKLKKDNQSIEKWEDFEMTAEMNPHFKPQIEHCGISQGSLKAFDFVIRFGDNDFMHKQTFGMLKSLGLETYYKGFGEYGNETMFEKRSLNFGGASTDDKLKKYYGKDPQTVLLAYEFLKRDYDELGWEFPLGKRL